MSATDRVKALAYGEEPEVTRTITLTGTPERVQRVINLLLMVRNFGGWGHSGTFGIAWDGDGSDKIQVEGATREEEAIAHDLCEATSRHGGEIEIVGDNNSSFVGRSVDDDGYLHLRWTKVHPIDPVPTPL